MSEPPAVPIRYSADSVRFEGSSRPLARSARTGELARLRRGSYVDSAEWKALTPTQQHFLRVIATSAAARTPPVFSHESAAVLSGFPIVEGLPHRLQITVPAGSGLKSNKLVVRHEARLDASDVIDIDHLRVTRIERTAVDFIASRSFLSGACALEWLLNTGRLDTTRLADAIERRRPFRGSRKAEAVARFASVFSDSPNETLCRVRFEQLGYAQPEQQRAFPGSRGRTFTVDFYWPDLDVICETDGRIKYEDPAYLAGRTPQEALWDEKAREDELRAQCRGFIRLTWDDAWNRAGLVAKLTRAGIPRRR
jgi:hypothetical protein